jgi:hypothetical protein
VRIEVQAAEDLFSAYLEGKVVKDSHVKLVLE